MDSLYIFKEEDEEINKKKNGISLITTIKDNSMICSLKYEQYQNLKPYITKRIHYIDRQIKKKKKFK